MTTSLKTCFKCNSVKPITEFYKHKMMNDGHLGKCKECAKSDVKINRVLRADYYKNFDRARANLPHRVAARKEYSQTLNYSISHTRSLRSYRTRHPDRYAAQSAVGNAIRDGRLERLPCLICGGEAEAHHPDYSLPLDVVWLCDEHHKQAHREHREIERQAMAANDK